MKFPVISSTVWVDFQILKKRGIFYQGQFGIQLSYISGLKIQSFAVRLNSDLTQMGIDRVAHNE